MKILHTSDWHIGRTLYGRKRYDEYTAFLHWLLHTIERHAIEVLIVAGDIFDTSSPSNRAQQLYYQFLKDVSSGCCRHVIIIGGNHDSPSLLEAPKELLRFFQVHVVGCAAENPADEVLVLTAPDGSDELIVCAVPYLRDREIRTARAGETPDEKNHNLINRIAEHYRQVAEIAQSRRQTSTNAPPIVATGHLFAAGGSRVEGDGVRDLYVGSLVYVDTTVFPDNIDYLALGHLHSSQLVGNNTRRRYCGSPLPMSFNEAGKDKSVLVVTMEDGSVITEQVRIPTFQRLQTVKGSLTEIMAEIEALKEQQAPIWLEVIYNGQDVITNLQLTLRDAVADSSLEILRIVNTRLIAKVLNRNTPRETLETMTEEAVFLRCLAAQQVPESQCDELIHLFRETLQAIADEDSLAE